MERQIQRRGPEWYARQLAAALAARLIGDGGDLADLVRAAIYEVVDQFGLRVGASPSSTVSLLRWDDEAIEAYVLADSPVVILLRDGSSVVLTDNRID